MRLKMINWKERYIREVEGLNNEGDPIGGDPPSGLRHQVEALKIQVFNLESLLDELRKGGLIVDAEYAASSTKEDKQ